MKLKKLGLLCSTLVTGIMLSPMASAILMDFTGSTGTLANGTTVATVGGVSATASATGEPVFRNAVEPGTALGVGTNVGNGAIANLAFTASNQSLTITFSETVTVNSIQLTQWENAFDGGFYTDANGTIDLAGQSTSGAFDLIDNFNIGLDTTSFTLSVPPGGFFGGVSAYYITSLDFSEIADPPDPVPVPGTLLLLGGGLLGLGATRRRKRQA